MPCCQLGLGAGIGGVVRSPVLSPRRAVPVSELILLFGVRVPPSKRLDAQSLRSGHALFARWRQRDGAGREADLRPDDWDAKAQIAALPDRAK